MRTTLPQTARPAALAGAIYATFSVAAYLVARAMSSQAADADIGAGLLVFLPALDGVFFFDAGTSHLPLCVGYAVNTILAAAAVFPRARRRDR